jgi:hypothetical protein
LRREKDGIGRSGQCGESFAEEVGVGVWIGGRRGVGDEMEVEGGGGDENGGGNLKWSLIIEVEVERILEFEMRLATYSNTVD